MRLQKDIKFDGAEKKRHQHFFFTVLNVLSDDSQRVEVCEFNQCHRCSGTLGEAAVQQSSRGVSTAHVFFDGLWQRILMARFVPCMDLLLLAVFVILQICK
jgi:hypothetical protein